MHDGTTLVRRRIEVSLHSMWSNDSSSNHDAAAGFVSKRRRRVQFDLGGTITIQHECGNDQERWYAPEEIKLFKKQVSSFAKQAVQEDGASPSSYTQTMIRTMRKCYEANDEDALLLLAQDESSSLAAVLGNVHAAKLQRYLEVSVDRLGIERRCVHKARGAKKNEMRKAIVAMVLQLQEALDEDDDMDRVIGTSCERLSLSCRLFARVLAQAHASSLDSDDEQSLIYL